MKNCLISKDGLCQVCDDGFHYKEGQCVESLKVATIILWDLKQKMNYPNLLLTNFWYLYIYFKKQSFCLNHSIILSFDHSINCL